MLTSYIVRPIPDDRAHEDAWILALDTSTELAGIALLRGETLRSSTWSSGRQQTTQVMPCLQEMLAASKLSTAEIGAVAVAAGPGSFTGLRVGMSIAKGLALGHDVPIVGVPTMTAVALPWVGAGVAVTAVLAAGRGRVVWQRFRPGHLEQDERAGATNGTPEELLEALDRDAVDAVVGELPEALRARLRPAPVPVFTETGTASRVVAVARLGRHRLSQGERDDLASLEPIYVHGTQKATRPVRDARPS